MAIKRILLVWLLCAASVGAAQKYYSPISINSAQVPSTQTDFPVLVSQTDARFKTTGNGGHVANANGFDIRPYTDTTLGTAITGYELERYNASTGEVIMWVKVSSLSSSTTPIVLGYGDTSITTDASSATTWSNGFVGVYHLKDGSTLDVNSATGSNNGTNHSATATAGQIDGGGSFASASNQYIDFGSGINPVSITLSVWVNATSLGASYQLAIGRVGVSQNCTNIMVKSTGKLLCACGTSPGNSRGYNGTGTHTLSTSTWYYLAMTCNQTSGIVGYVNGASDGTSTGLDNNVSGAVAQIGGTGGYDQGGNFNTGYWNGKLDEARFANVIRSSDWLLTEYNNQFAPGTFETLGTEVSLTNSSTDKFFMFFPQ